MVSALASGRISAHWRLRSQSRPPIERQIAADGCGVRPRLPARCRRHCLETARLALPVRACAQRGSRQRTSRPSPHNAIGRQRGIGSGGDQSPDRRDQRSSGHDSREINASKMPSRPGEFHPEPLTDSGLEPLDSSGSCHRTKAAAFRCISGSSRCRLPNNQLTRSNGGDLPPSLHGHCPASSLLRSSPPLPGASVLSASRLAPLAPFPLASPVRFSRSVQEPG